jgi:hypothetical protein
MSGNALAGTPDEARRQEIARRIDQIIGWAKAGTRSGAGADYYLMDKENVDRMRDDILAALGYAREPAAAGPCPECGGKGYTEGPGCNCGVGPSGYYGMHERYCGLEPCPRGCPFVGPSAPETS